jgi:ankyrin repeat protein
MPLRKSGNARRRNTALDRKPKNQLLGRRLAAAAANGDLVGISKLLMGGASANYQNRSGESVLSFAAAWNQLDAARLLLQLGADPNLADKTGGTALMLAAQHGSPELVRMLLQEGANAKAKDNANNTALKHADWREDGEGYRIRELIRKASDVKQHAIA